MITGAELDAMEAEWKRQATEFKAEQVAHEARIAVIQAGIEETIRICNEPLLAFQAELKASKGLHSP